MPWAFVSATANGISNQQTITKSVTAGNLVVMIVTMENGTDTPTISDGVNTWNQVTASPLKDATNGAGMAMWWAVAATTASITVTVSNRASAVGYGLNSLAEWSGNAASSLADGSAGAANIAASTATDGQASGSFATGTAGDLIVAAIIDVQAAVADSLPQYTAGTGFTRRDTASLDTGSLGNGQAFAVEESVQANAGTINPTFTARLSHKAIALAAAFKVAGGAGANDLAANLREPSGPPSYF
jgi:hypothetical protein